MPAGGAEGNRAVATWAWVAAKGERLPHSLHVVAVQHVGECDDGRVPVARERAHARAESDLVGVRLATSCVQVQRVHIQRCVVPGGGGEERSVLSPQRGCSSSRPGQNKHTGLGACGLGLGLWWQEDVFCSLDGPWAPCENSTIANKGLRQTALVGASAADLDEFVLRWTPRSRTIDAAALRRTRRASKH